MPDDHRFTRRSPGTSALVGVRTNRAGRALIAAVLCLLLAATGFVVPAPARADRTPEISQAQVRSKQWWISRLGLESVWKASTGRGVTVAVLDEGVDPNFGGPRAGDLTGAVIPGFGAEGSGGDGRTDRSPNNHGSQMATLIAGRGTGFGVTGVARGAKILPVYMPNTQRETIADALDRLSTMSSPPAVVSMSLGEPGACGTTLQEAVRRAVNKGLILVASSGNEPQPDSLSPANCAGVVSVGALKNSDPPTVWERSRKDQYVSLTAPGVDMITYGPDDPLGYGYASGTSEATAIASGTMAVVRAKFPTESSRQIVARVLATAKQFQGAAGTRNNSYGYGVALPAKALQTSVPANAPNPIYDALAALPASGSSSGAASTAPTGAASSGSSSAPTEDPVAAPDSDGGGSSTGLIIGIVIGVLVLVLLIVIIAVRRRSRVAPAGPPPGWGGPPPPA